jgi:hypothetical protein
MKLKLLEPLTGVDIIKLKCWLAKLDKAELVYRKHCPFSDQWVKTLSVDNDYLCGVTVNEIKAFETKDCSYIGADHYFCKICYFLIKSNPDSARGLRLNKDSEPFPERDNCPCENFRGIVKLTIEINKLLKQYENLANEKIAEFMIKLEKYRGVEKSKT